MLIWLHKYEGSDKVQGSHVEIITVLPAEEEAAVPVELAGVEGRGELQLAGRHSHRPHQVLHRPEPLSQLGRQALHLLQLVAALLVLPDHHLRRSPAVPGAVWR